MLEWWKIGPVAARIRNGDGLPSILHTGRAQHRGDDDRGIFQLDIDLT